VDGLLNRMAHIDHIADTNGRQILLKEKIKI